MRNLLSVVKSLPLILFLVCCKGNDESPDDADFDIYVSDAGNPWKILKYDGNGTDGATFIDKNLGWPQDIVFLEDQKIMLVSNLTTGDIIRCDISSGAFIDKFASGISGPTRMKIGKDKLLYVLQWNGDGRVLRYKLDGTFVDIFTETGVVQGIGIDWDAAGNLYVSSYNKGNGGFVRKFDTAGKDLGNFISSGLAGPTNIWFEADGNLMVIDYSAGAVKRFSPDGSLKSAVIGALAQPEGVTVMDDGTLLIGNGGSGSVKMYDKEYKLIKDIVAPGSAGLKRPNVVVTRKK